MKYPPAILCALGIVAAQVYYGGIYRQVFALPGFLLVALAGVFGAWSVFAKERHPPRTLPVFLTALFAAWLCWRIVDAPPGLESSSLLRLVLACLTAYLVFATAATSSKARLIFFVVLFLAALIQASVGGYQFLRKLPDMPMPWASDALKAWYGSRLGSRAHGFFINGNHLAWFLNVSALSALSAACWARWPVWARVLALYVAAVCFAGCLPTLSRGGFLGLATGLSVFLLLSGYALAFGARGRRLAASIVIVAGVLIAAGSAWFVYSESFTVQSRLSFLTQDAYREKIYESSRRLFESSPLMGAGAGSFKQAARQYRTSLFVGDDVFAHNDWFQIAAEFGFPALALLLLVVGCHAVTGLSGLRTILERRMAASSGASSNGTAIQIAALTILATCSVHSFFDFNMQIPANALLAAACLGMLANPGLTSRRPLAAMACGSWGLLTAGLAVLFGAMVIVSAPSQIRHLQAENALYAGRFDESIDLASTQLVENPDDIDLRLIRARAYLKRSSERPLRNLQKEDARLAMQDFETARAQRPLDAHELIGLATACGREGSPELAQIYAAQAVADFPLFHGGYLVLGMALEAQNEPEMALRMYALGASLPDARDAAGRFRTLQKELQKK